MWVGGERALNEPVEGQPAVARATAVEAERELVEVEVELPVGDGTLVGSEPAFEQRGDAVDVGHRDVGGVAGGLTLSTTCEKR